MIKSEITIRVRYGETDRMGFVYYGNYAIYFEVARVEMLRELGIAYKDMEDSGIALPVLEYKVKYLKPAFYDELLTIKTIISKRPGIRIRFDYETYNIAGDLLNIAETTLVFMNGTTLRPCPAPVYFEDKIDQYFPR